MAALLEVRDLSKRFATRAGREPSPWIIQGLSFSVEEGEFLTIIGPSGGGKTTILNMIAQIDTATNSMIHKVRKSAVNHEIILNNKLAAETESRQAAAEISNGKAKKEPKSFDTEQINKAKNSYKSQDSQNNNDFNKIS